MKGDILINSIVQYSNYYKYVFSCLCSFNTGPSKYFAVLRTMENSSSPILSSPTSKVIDDLVLKSDTLHEICRQPRVMSVVSAASLEAQLMVCLSFGFFSTI